jgi:hypothetical protein
MSIWGPLSRVARFKKIHVSYWEKNFTKLLQNMPNGHKMPQMALNIPNGLKIYTNIYEYIIIIL